MITMSPEAKEKTCDKCGQFTKCDRFGFFSPDMDYPLIRVPSGIVSISMDLCESCANEYADWIDFRRRMIERGRPC